MDRLATRTDALTRQEAYQYDPAGNLTTFTDRRGQASSFTYDNLNRRIGAQYADGSSTSFTYDSVGRLATVTDSVSGTIQFSYDMLDRLIQETTAQGSVQYTYDALGRRTSMTVSGQQPVTYQYDAASRLTQVAQGSLVVTIGYDAAGRRTSLTYPNGTSTSYTYDNASRLTNITHNGPGGVIESVTYTYDAASNRLTANRASGSATAVPNATTASYDAANELTVIASGATQSLTYDQNGNLINDGLNTYTWDARNRLTTISGGVSASFTYDALGRRISKTINGVTTQFLYDGRDIVAEIGGAAVSATYLRSLSIDEPFIRIIASGNEFYHGGALGSALALTNGTGAVQASYTYEPFGKTTIVGSSTNPFQYTGRESDGTGLYYYRARYYAPSFSRFVSEDKLRVFQEFNLYIYVLNVPINYKDPTGLKLEVDPDLLPALAKVKSTGRGLALYNQLQDDPDVTYRIIAVPNSNVASTTRDRRRVFLDPNAERPFCSNGNVYPASIERILAHEMGHMAGYDDDGPGELNNVDINENPAAVFWGQPKRTQYNPFPCKTK